MPRGIYQRRIVCVVCGKMILTSGAKTIRCKRCQKKIHHDKARERIKSQLDKIKVRVLKRDNNECQICGQKHTLNIHHFNEDVKDNRYWNLLTLCASCHKMVHNGYF